MREVEVLKSFERKYKFDFEIEEKLKRDTVAWKHQLSAGEYALKSSYKKALKEWDKVFTGREESFSQEKGDSLRKIYKVLNAKDVIIKKAKNTSVVVINEAHHNSLHRQFTKTLLKELYKIGYRHLGLEALMNGVGKDSILNSRKYPVKSSGYYTNDPSFSQLIREATKLGFNVFSYEQNTGVNGRFREIEQAKNIKKMMDKFPNEKVLIHCGFDHVLEGNHKRWGKTMTGRLKEYMDIDPLTINQTKYSEKGDYKINTPMLKVFNVKEPSVLQNIEGEFYKYRRGDNWTDIAVFHPSIKEDNIYLDEVIDYKVSIEKVNLTYPLMILAFDKKDNVKEAVPISIYEVLDKNKAVSMKLPKGEYDFVAVNKENKAVKF